MKNLLLAFALIGFMATSYASTAVLSTTNTEMTEGDPEKCTKKDCKHDTKECKDHKKADKKSCKKGDSKKACCSKDSKKSCHSKDAKKADKK